MTAEEWGWAALQRHGGAAGEAGGQTEAVERQAEAVSGASESSKSEAALAKSSLKKQFKGIFQNVSKVDYDLGAALG